MKVKPARFDRPARAQARHDRLPRQVRADIWRPAAGQPRPHSVNGTSAIRFARVDVGDVMRTRPKAQDMALVSSAGLAERRRAGICRARRTAKVTFNACDAGRGPLSGPHEPNLVVEFYSR